jgi:transcriptional regulator with XRE-family HTH domain
MAKTIREQRGLTQVQLAERSALTVSGICQQAQGRRKHLLFESVVRLARALDVRQTTSRSATSSGRSRSDRP